MKKIIYSVWAVSTISLFLYSFTQIDLSLTVTQNSTLHSIQKSFQEIGYFNRQLSATLFATIIAMLTLSYILIIKGVKEHVLSAKEVWRIALISTGLLLFSYNAFSYDIFNYIFDAKIVTFYSKNPYLHKALDFPTDPMLSFMRWTHRTYPYGPAWLGLTIPISYLGLQVFTVTYFLFKSLMAGAFLATAYMIKKIAKETKLIDPALAVAVFALNPLVLTESVVSAHNDIVMIFFASVSTYYFVKKRYTKSSLFLIISGGIKFATFLIAPIFVLYSIYQLLTKKEHMRNLFRLILLSMIAAVALASLRTNFQPWYMLYIAFPAALLSKHKYVRYPYILISAVTLAQYLPFLYTGNWDPPIPTLLQTMTLSSTIVTGIFVAVLYALHVKKRRHSKLRKK